MEIINNIVVNIVWTITEDGTIPYTGYCAFTNDEWLSMTEEDLLKIQTDEYNAWKFRQSQG